MKTNKSTGILYMTLVDFFESVKKIERQMKRSGLNPEEFNVAYCDTDFDYDVDLEMQLHSMSLSEEDKILRII